MTPLLQAVGVWVLPEAAAHMLCWSIFVWWAPRQGLLSAVQDMVPCKLKGWTSAAGDFTCLVPWKSNFSPLE